VGGAHPTNYELEELRPCDRRTPELALCHAILSVVRGIPRIAVSGWRRFASNSFPPAISWRRS
jgi:hypothetical protein